MVGIAPLGSPLNWQRRGKRYAGGLLGPGAITILLLVVASACGTSAPARAGIAIPRGVTPNPSTVVTAQATPQSIQAYRATVNQESVELVLSLQRFSTLASSPRPTDSGWTDQLSLEISLWKSVYDAAQRLVPPACLVPIHRQWLSLLQRLSGVADLVSAGAASNNSDSLAVGAAQVGVARDQIGTIDASLVRTSC